MYISEQLQLIQEDLRTFLNIQEVFMREIISRTELM